MLVCLVALSGGGALAGNPAPAGEVPGGPPLPRIIAQADEPPADEQDAPEGSLPDEIELVLTGILQGGGMQAAILENRATKEQRVYKLGDSAGEGRLTKILPDRVVLTFPEGEVELRLGATPSGEPASQDSRGQVPPGAAGSAPAPGSEDPGRFPAVDRDTLLKLSEAPELLAHLQTLGDRGVQLGEVRPGDLLDTLGLQKGDIIVAVNTQTPAASFPEAIRQALQQGPLLRLQIERDGRPEAVYVRILPSPAPGAGVR